MSYVISPSGVSNPLTENLDAGGFDIDDADTINTVTINGATPAGLTIGSNATQKVGFHGVTPVVRAGAITPVASSPAPPVYDNLALDANFSNIDDAINDILTALQNIGITA
jgi:hypothetical protein